MAVREVVTGQDQFINVNMSPMFLKYTSRTIANVTKGRLNLRLDLETDAVYDKNSVDHPLDVQVVGNTIRAIVRAADTANISVGETYLISASFDFDDGGSVTWEPDAWKGESRKIKFLQQGMV